MIEYKSQMNTRSPGGSYCQSPKKRKIGWETRRGKNSELTFDMVSFRWWSDIQGTVTCRIEIINYYARNMLQDSWESDLQSSGESGKTKLVSSVSFLVCSPMCHAMLSLSLCIMMWKGWELHWMKKNIRNSKNEMVLWKPRCVNTIRERIGSYDPKAQLKWGLLRLTLRITLVMFIIPVLLESWGRNSLRVLRSERDTWNLTLWV